MAPARTARKRADVFSILPRSVLFVVGFAISAIALYYYDSWVGVLLNQSEQSRFPEGLFDADLSQTDTDVWEDRATQIREAFQHAYRGYERYAMAHDELLPLSDGHIDNFNGWGVTAVDSLDTMLLMGLEDEFKRAMAIVEKETFSLRKNAFAPYFETVIRYLGGLLSAYALSENPVLLQRADELAQKLDPVFNTTSGFPFFGVNTDSGETLGPNVGNLAEIATLQLEYTYLANATGKAHYAKRADTIIQALANANLGRSGGMLPIKWDLSSSMPIDGHTSAGARADSAHEYLLKQYLLTNRTDKINLEMYLRTTTYIMSQLMFISNNRQLVYATDRPSPESLFTIDQLKPGGPSHVLEHLTCFLPGLFALGAHTLLLDDLQSIEIDYASLHTQGNSSQQAFDAIKGFSSLKQLHLWAAESLAETCWLMYADQPTGLSPDEVIFAESWQYGHETLWIDALNHWRKDDGGQGLLPPGVGSKQPVVYTEKERMSGTGRGRDYFVKKTEYLLRPETVESLFLLWKTTGNSKWRERGWWIFKALEKESKTESGFASLLSVEVTPAPKDDSMPSYFLAETLKYLYLLCKNDDLVPLDKWVFNTEAHPFPVFQPAI